MNKLNLLYNLLLLYFDSYVNNSIFLLKEPVIYIEQLFL